MSVNGADNHHQSLAQVKAVSANNALAILRIYTPKPSERQKIITDRLLKYGNQNLQECLVAKVNGSWTVIDKQGRVIITVTPSEAERYGMDAKAVAEQWAKEIKALANKYVLVPADSDPKRNMIAGAGLMGIGSLMLLDDVSGIGVADDVVAVPTLLKGATMILGVVLGGLLLSSCTRTKPNQPPVITSTPIESAQIGMEYSYQVTADDGNNDPLTFSLDNPPDGMIISSSGKITWTPSSAGIYPIKIKVTDGKDPIFQEFNLTVNPKPNTPPEITSTPVRTATVGIAYSYDVNATDGDGDTLTYTLDSKPEGMTINESTGVISWTPTSIGSFSVKVLIDDGTVQIPHEFTITVSLTPNQPPLITSNPIINAAPNLPYTYDVNASDADNDPLTYSLEAKPLGMTIDPSTGMISWTPTLTQTGSTAVRVKVTDGIDSTYQDINIAVSTRVTVSGREILINGSAYLAKSVGYAPTPIGNIASQPPYGDYFTANYNQIYERDLPLLREMHCNTVRLWGWEPTANHDDFLNKCYNNGNDPIYVIAGLWVDYQYDDLSNPTIRQKYLDNFRTMVHNNKNNPAIVMWSFGNEVGHFYPIYQGGKIADWLSLLNEAANIAHEEEGEFHHPVTTASLNLDEVEGYNSAVPNLDVWGINAYWGPSFGNLFTRYQAASNKPMFFTEYGIDAYDNVHGNEYELADPPNPQQANYAASLWGEMVTNRNICSGGSIMAYCDEWYKDWNAGQPMVHNPGGYATNSHPDLFANEEWWGIMRTIDNGDNPDIMQPRKVYDILQNLWQGN